MESAGTLGALIVLFVALAGAVRVVRDTRRGYGQWGINLKGASCPDCGVPAPRIRFPCNSHQFVWGGWTCRECGREFDKWGHRRLER